MTRCPTCGHKVESIFDHVHIECEADMTDAEIARLIQDADPDGIENAFGEAADQPTEKLGSLTDIATGTLSGPC